jgi:hypothetical protein
MTRFLLGPQITITAQQRPAQPAFQPDQCHQSVAINLFPFFLGGLLGGFLCLGSFTRRRDQVQRPKYPVFASKAVVELTKPPL